MGGYGFVPGVDRSLADLITGFGQQKATIAATQAQTEHANAATGLTRQQEEAARLENEQRQRALKDAEITRSIYADMASLPAQQSQPTTGNPALSSPAATPPFVPNGQPFNANRFLGEFYKRGGSVPGGQGLAEHFQKLQKGQLDIDEKVRGEEAARNAKIGELYTTVLMAPPDSRAAMMQQIGPALDALDPSHPHSQTPLDDVSLRAAIGVAQHGAALAGREKAAADLAHTQAQTGEATARTQETQQALKDKQRQAAATALAIAQTPEQYEAARTKFGDVGASFPAAAEVFGPAGMTAPGKSRVLNLGRTAQEQVQSQEEAAKLAQQQAQAAETARHNKAAEANQAGELGVARGRLGIEQKRFEADYGDGVPEELKGIPKKDRDAAKGLAVKADTEYRNANAAADELQKVIDLAKGGNKAAQGNLPVLGVGAINAINGIKRFNRTEIEQYGGAGSLWDSIQGKVGKLVAGKPIPPDVLKDIEFMHNSLRSGSRHKYEQAIDSVNTRYGSKLKPMADGTLPQGGGKAIDKATAQKFYDAAGGDPKKAQELAEKSGWKVQ